MKSRSLLILFAAALTLWVTAASAQTESVPPPSTAPLRSAAELEQLVAPIALYPDPLIATILPASVYPLEIVQAARFVSDPNNLINLDGQPWDDNVKAVARVPEVIKKMNDDLKWTMDLGEAFLAQDSELMEAIQRLRSQAQTAGTLQTTPQQIVVVTNTIVERTYEQSIVYVTNTIVQIQPANPQVIYVPYYNPTVIYVPPPVVTFAVGISVGFIMANNCNWYYGGCYRGYYPPPPPRWPPPYYPPPGRPPYYPPPGYRPPPPGSPPGYRPPPPPGYRPYNPPPGASQPWTPNPARLNSAGTPTAAALTRSPEARGWSSGNTRTGTSPAPGVSTRPATVNPSLPANRPTTGNIGNPNTQPANRPNTGNVGNPGTQPAPGYNGTRPTTGATPPASPPSTQPAGNSGGGRPAQTQPAQGGSSSGSAFSGANRDTNTRGASNRGAASRSGNGGGGGGLRRGN